MKRLWALAALSLLVGCSTMTPARYSVSVDNNLALKQFAGKSFWIASIDSPASFDANCRVMGPIQASDGMSIPQFVHKAFNDELKLAGLYSEKGMTLSGALTKVEFSSTAGVTGGWWDLALTLKSTNGKVMAVQNRYEFKSGFDAITACNQTAQALGPAVQDLIKKAVTDPRFGGLIQ
jgi:hypothetical protein